MRAPSSIVLSALIAAGISGCAGSSAASCVAPTVTLSTTTAAAGESISLTGEHFVAGCNDTGQGVPTPGAADVPVTLRTTDNRVLATLDADESGHLAATVTIPSDMEPGTAAIVVGSAMPVAITVTSD